MPLTGGRGHDSAAVFQKVHWHGCGFWHAGRQLTVHARNTVPLTLGIAIHSSNSARCGVWRGITSGGALAFALSFPLARRDVPGQVIRDMYQRHFRELLPVTTVATVRATWKATQQFCVNSGVAAVPSVLENPKRTSSRCGTKPAESS